MEQEEDYDSAIRATREIFPNLPSELFFSNSESEEKSTELHSGTVENNTVKQLDNISNDIIIESSGQKISESSPEILNLGFDSNQNKEKAVMPYKAILTDFNSGFEKDSKEYTTYRIDVQCGSQSWTEYRRYREFRELYDVLKKKISKRFLGQFPKKQVIGRLTEKTIDLRQTYFHGFVEKINQDVNVAFCSEVLTFFGVQSNVILPAVKENNVAALAPFLALPSSSINLKSVLRESGMSLIHTAIEAGELETVKILCDYGVELSGKYKGITALHRAVIQSNPLVVAQLLNNRERLRLNIDEVDSKGRTALHYAAHSGNRDILKLVLESGADTCKADCNRNTSLHVAARLGLAQCVECLVLYGGENFENFENENQSTALHEAAVKGHFDVVVALVNSRAFCDPSDSKGDTPLTLLCSQAEAPELRTMEIVDFLIGKGASPDGGIIENSNSVSSTKLLGRHSADIGSSKGGTTPLFWAAFNNRLDLMRLLVRKGASINHCHSKSGKTALHGICWAAEKDNTDKYFLPAVLLVELGAFITSKDVNGHTPLDLAPSPLRVLLTEAAVRSPLSTILKARTRILAD